ncbi:MAG: DoxX family protein [Neisseria sp.]|nr:DoxX family protein [Neisseria sp.]
MKCQAGKTCEWGRDVSLLLLRAFVAWEFFEAGWGKWQGENWFADIQADFPFPFSVLPPEWSWQMAMWTELAAPVLLLIGVLGRWSALSLLVLTAVAWAAVHAGNGYNVCDNGYKMALIYALMLVVLLLQGMGRFSLAYWVCGKRCHAK